MNAVAFLSSVHTDDVLRIGTCIHDKQAFINLDDVLNHVQYKVFCETASTHVWPHVTLEQALYYIDEVPEKNLSKYRLRAVVKLWDTSRNVALVRYVPQGQGSPPGQTAPTSQYMTLHSSLAQSDAGDDEDSDGGGENSDNGTGNGNGTLIVVPKGTCYGSGNNHAEEWRATAVIHLGREFIERAYAFVGKNKDDILKDAIMLAGVWCTGDGEMLG